MEELKKSTIICIIIDLIANIGLFSYFKLQNISLNSILICISIIVQFIIVNMSIKVLTKRKAIFISILSLIYATLIVLGMQLEMYSDIQWRKLTAIAIVGMGCFIFIIILFIYSALENYRNKFSYKDYEIKIKDKHIKIITFFTIFIFWTIGYMAAFPGVYGYDAGFQILQFQDSAIKVTSHFSIVYSFVLYLFICVGKTFFNKYSIGFALYTFIQMLFIIYVVYKICMYLYNKYKNKYVLIGSMAFFLLIPYNFILSISSCQDTIFGGIFALIVLSILNILEDPKYLENKKNVIFFIVKLILLCLIRNNGIYILIISLPILVFFLQRKRIKITVIFIISIILMKLIQTILFSAFDVGKGNSLREMMSIPVQQLGRTYCYSSENLSDEQKKYILTLIPADKLEIYKLNPCISDALKENLNTDLIKRDYVDFFTEYVGIGLKNKTNYIEAFLLNNLGLWYPDKSYPDSRMYHPLLEYKMLEAKKWNEKYIEIERHSFIPCIDKAFTVLIGEGEISKIPVVSTISSMGTATFIMIFSIIMILYKKRYKYISVFAVIFSLYLTVILAPVSLYRYMYGIMLIIPIIISLPFNNKKDN